MKRQMTYKFHILHNLIRELHSAQQTYANAPIKLFDNSHTKIIYCHILPTSVNWGSRVPPVKVA